MILKNVRTHINLSVRAGGRRADAAFASNTPVFDLAAAFGPRRPFMCCYITRHSGIYIHPSVITSFYIRCGLEITPCVLRGWRFGFLNPKTFCASMTELISYSFQGRNPQTDLSLKGPVCGI